MHRLTVFDTELLLLPSHAIYVSSLDILLVSDIHLGKSETFQRAGIPIPSQVNQSNLDRLTSLCHQFQPKQLWVLGDLFHARTGMGDELVQVWQPFVENLGATVHLVLGNHDRPLIPHLAPFGLECHTGAIALGNLILSHEPSPTPSRLNLCGHIHPCLRLRSRLDDLRLPCFFFDRAQNLLVLPSFGEFTGGYEMTPTQDTVIYAIADESIVPFAGIPMGL
ncbi:ligase-associated DNA damage response endonuclease PdeM [Vacuolonema iberomarrocanum]|uniref:ligase-associated DNA damage response endonuclease PdeM n=1 Tax=Vacuolonema iberomarrocanum TaxID=3454632 RepID=UPI0019E26BC2|nr:ligase-associated DNA damage response endonuclease PdeM [filamentous cyanobacterium LEGE 07170]